MASDNVTILKIDKGTELSVALLKFVGNCSWEETKAHISQMLSNWEFTDWETMFAALIDGKIVGMASAMKSDYYPLPDIFPWVSCIFVSEDVRGRRISEKLIDFANRYLKTQGFDKSYISAGCFGLYELYGYRFVKDIVNYGGGTDHLFVKEL